MSVSSSSGLHLPGTLSQSSGPILLGRPTLLMTDQALAANGLTTAVSCPVSVRNLLKYQDMNFSTNSSV